MSYVDDVMAEAAAKLRARLGHLDDSVAKGRALIERAQAERREIDRTLRRIEGKRKGPPAGEQILAVFNGKPLTRSEIAELVEVDGRAMSGALTQLVRHGRLTRKGERYVKAGE